MTVSSALIFLIILKFTTAKTIYGDGCEDLVYSNKSFVCIRLDDYQFIPCYIPKSGVSLDGCVIEDHESE